jgi:hypothetical protein
MFHERENNFTKLVFHTVPTSQQASNRQIKQPLVLWMDHLYASMTSIIRGGA